MNEGLISDEKLKQSYRTLQKFADQVKKDCNKLMDSEFGEDEWKKEGKKIDINLKKFDKIYKEIKTNVQNAKDNGNVNGESLEIIEEGLENIKENVEPMVERMKDKIGNFENNYEMEGGDNKEENEEEQEQEQGQIVMDLMNNKEVLEIRRKELEDIHKTNALIKDTTDIMAVKVKEQADILDNVENNVIKTEDNVDKANKEIIKANELSKSNNKRLCCIMLIVTVAIGVILSIVLSLVL